MEFLVMYSVDIKFWILFLNLLLAFMASYLMSLGLLLTFCKIMIATYLTEVLRLNKVNLFQSPLMKGCVYCKVLLYITCVYIAYPYVICIIMYIT